MTDIKCPRCEREAIAYGDYVCWRCRNTLDGKNICDICSEVYNPAGWADLKGQEHIGHAPRFAGLCQACKDVAGLCTDLHFYTLPREAREAET